MGQGRISLFSSVIASICIIVYIAAIVFGAVQVTLSMNSRRTLAAQEFSGIANRASTAASLGFMSEDYQLAMMDALDESRTILGIIISGSNGQFGFERRPGTVISRVGDSPRFKPGFGMPSDPFHKVINISGQRNGTIQAQYSLIDYDVLLDALKNTLTVILGALALAIFALIIEIALKNRSRQYAGVKAGTQYSAGSIVDKIMQRSGSGTNHVSSKTENEKPQGLYSPRSNVGWEIYTRDRLASELEKCTSSGGDIVFILLEHDKKAGRLLSDDKVYHRFAKEIHDFFGSKDLIFEKGKYGFAVIIPGVGLEKGMSKSEEFIKLLEEKLPDIPGGSLRIGLSSRSGRQVDADRFIFESSVALEKATKAADASIVGFKSDPAKFRDFISRS